MANLSMSTVGGGDCGNGWTTVAASGLGAGALMGGEAAKPEAQAKAQMAIFVVIMIISQQWAAKWALGGSGHPP